MKNGLSLWDDTDNEGPFIMLFFYLITMIHSSNKAFIFKVAYLF